MCLRLVRVQGGWAEGETPMIKMVFIGHNLDREALVKGVHDCRA